MVTLDAGASPGALAYPMAYDVAFHVEGRSPKAGHRTAAEAMQFPWRWNGGTIFPEFGIT